MRMFSFFFLLVSLQFILIQLFMSSCGTSNNLLLNTGALWKSTPVLPNYLREIQRKKKRVKPKYIAYLVKYELFPDMKTGVCFILRMWFPWTSKRVFKIIIINWFYKETIKQQWWECICIQLKRGKDKKERRKEEERREGEKEKAAGGERGRSQAKKGEKKVGVEGGKEKERKRRENTLESTKMIMQKCLTSKM